MAFNTPFLFAKHPTIKYLGFVKSDYFCRSCEMCNKKMGKNESIYDFKCIVELRVCEDCSHRLFHELSGLFYFLTYMD